MDCSFTILSSPFLTAHSWSFFLFSSPFITTAKFNSELIRLQCTLGSLCQMNSSLCPLFSTSSLYMLWKVADESEAKQSTQIEAFHESLSKGCPLKTCFSIILEHHRGSNITVSPPLHGPQMCVRVCVGLHVDLTVIFLIITNPHTCYLRVKRAISGKTE